MECLRSEEGSWYQTTREEAVAMVVQGKHRVDVGWIELRLCWVGVWQCKLEAVSEQFAHLGLRNLPPGKRPVASRPRWRPRNHPSPKPSSNSTSSTRSALRRVSSSVLRASKSSAFRSALPYTLLKGVYLRTTTRTSPACKASGLRSCEGKAMAGGTEAVNGEMARAGATLRQLSSSHPP